MRAILAVMAMLLCISLGAQIPEAPAQGNGSSSDPYHIASFGNLYWLTLTPGVWGMHFIQTADIDAGDSALISSPEPNTLGWIPIGCSSPFFTGAFDGQGYRIHNLYMHRPSLQYAGLFGYLNGARINRIHLRDVSITGNSYSGGLAGVANSGSVVNNCSTTGNVSGVINVGGLLGYCDGSGSTNSYSHASVTASGDQAGGFVGLSGWNNSSYHQFCYSTGSVSTPSSYKGGFIGRTGSVSIRDCFWDIEASGIPTDPLAVGKSTTQMQQQYTYARWNFQNQWSIEENLSYPNLDGLLYHALPPALEITDLMGDGTAESPYLLMNAAQLNVMRQDLDACYALGADIDLSSSVAWNHGKGWEAVGTNISPFTGRFDGMGHTISGLTICSPKTDYLGLFGYTMGASIRRVNLPDAYLLGQSNVGGAVGYSKTSSIDEISFEGTILAHSASGGIAGVVENGSLQRSWANVDMKNYSDYAGGLVGYITSSGNIISGIASNSGCAGSVEGSSNVGGLVGMVAWGYILNSYSHAMVYGANQAGGLVGSVGWSNPGHVSRCYSTGAVTTGPSGSSGGLIARFMAGSIRECYWDTQSSGMASSSGLGASGKTTAEMMQQSTFLRWNFTALWQMGRRGYPAHQDLSIHTLPMPVSPGELLGSGTPGDPYVILTIDQLNVMHQAPGASYYLNNDLDLGATCVWSGGRGWLPVGSMANPFTGSFDGGGNELSYLSMILPDWDNVGFLGYTSGSHVRALGFTDANIQGKNNVGCVAGYALDSRIDGVEVRGTVSANDSAGGIAGQLNRGIIQRGKADVTCWAGANNAGGIVGNVSSDAGFLSAVSTCEASGYVRASQNAGGLVGTLGYGSLINSSSHVSVQAYSQFGGVVGLCGWSYPGTVVRCFAAGQIIAEPGGYSQGGLVGRLQSGQVYNSYWDTQTSGITAGATVDMTGLTTAAMRQQASYKNWDFSALWLISEGTDYPRMRDLSIHQDPDPVALDQMLGDGTSGNPYLILTPSHLNAMRQNLSAHYLILEDLDLSATLVWNGGRGWLPVGTASQPFTGTFDGGGEAVSALSIMAPLTDYAGFFGKAQNAVVSDLKLWDLSLAGELNLGGLAGFASTCTISGVEAQAMLDGNGLIGGLLGAASGGTVQNCSSDASVLARSHQIGALIGSVQGNCQISRCSTTGTLKGATKVGGITGELYYGSIADSYSHASVRALQELGGAVGIIGWGSPGQLTRCYSTGLVSVLPGGYYAGGLVGRLYNGTIQDSHWDTATSGMSISSGAGATGLSTSQITYPGSLNYFGTWDFANIWRQDDSSQQNGGYPYLAWQQSAVPDAVQDLVISASESQFLLQWQPVAGAGLYKVYASEDPYAPWNQWIYLGQTSATSYLAAGGDKRFFIVRGVGD